MSAESRWLRDCSTFVVGLACACGPTAAVPGGDSTTSGTTTSMPGSSTSTGVEPRPTTDAPDDTSHGETTRAETTTSSSSSDDGGNPFLIEPDGWPTSLECDIWADDCPAGHKCMPWANDGGSSWNAVRCSPIAENARDVGDPCTVEGSGVSGIDDCVARAMCWDVDPETNEGTCVGFCSGSQANPTCSMPCDSCVIANEGVLILCLPTCDPLVQDCGEGQGCWPTTQGAFHCVYFAQSEGVHGYPCTNSFWDCDPGLACIEPERVPGCTGANGCCASFCDTADHGACANYEGTTCVPWFGPGESPPCITETLGVCALPEGV
jgi:hypothetical protein